MVCGVGALLGVAAMLGLKRGPAEVLGSDADEPFGLRSPRPPAPPLPWQERALRAALADPSPTVRWLAVREAVGQGWAPRFLRIEELKGMLQSPEIGARCHALAGLAQFSVAGTRCVGDVVPLLKDENEWVRKSAVEALGQMGREAVPFAKDLVPLLSDESSSVWTVAGDALGSLGRVDAPVVIALMQPLLRPADTGTAAGVAARPAPPPAPAAAAPDPFGPLPSSPADVSFREQSTLRCRAARVLGNTGKAGAALAVPLLKPLLQDADDSVRYDAQRALSDLKDEAPESVAEALKQYVPPAPPPLTAERVSALIPQLGAADDDTRSAAIAGLAQDGAQTAPQVISALLPLLQEADFHTACGAAAALLKTGHETTACRSALLLLLKSPDAGARRLAVETLNAAGPGADAAAVVLPALLPLLHDTDGNVRFVASDVFHDWGAAAAPYVKDFLRQLTDSSSAESLRICAMHALAGAGVNEAAAVVRALQSVFASPSSDVKRNAVYALEDMARQKMPAASAALVEVLKDGDSSVKSHALMALESLGRDTTTYLHAVLPLLRDSSSLVRYHAFTAVRSMGPEATPALVPELLPLLLHPGGPMHAPEVASDAYGWGGIRFSAAELPLQVVAALQRAGRGGEPAAFQAMLTVLRQAEADYDKRMAAEQLCAMSEKVPNYTQELLPLLQDSHERVRLHALEALGAAPVKDAPVVTRALLPLLPKMEGEEKYRLIDALAHLGPAAAPVVIPALLTLVNDPDSTVKVRMVFAMQDMGAAAAPHAAALLPLLQDSEGVVKSKTLWTLASLGPQALPVLVQALPQLLRDNSHNPGGMDMYELELPLIACDALRRIGKTAAPQVAQALLPLLRHEDAAVRSCVMETLDSICPLKQSPAWQCAALAAALGFSKEEDTQELRFHLHLWSGDDDTLLLSVRWLGKPAASPMPANGAALSAQDQQAVLGMLLTLWPHSAPFPALRQEMAGRIAQVAQGISAASEEKVAELLKKMDGLLKADDVRDSQATSAKARDEVQSVLVRGKGKR